MQGRRLKNSQVLSQSQSKKPQGFCITITMAIGPLFKPRCYDSLCVKKSAIPGTIYVYTSINNNNAQRFDLWSLSSGHTILYEKTMILTGF